MTKVLFVSNRFLLPPDSGGTIRSTLVLRGLKSLGYEITLVSPSTRAKETMHRSDLAELADEWIGWPEPSGRPLFWHGAAEPLLARVPRGVAQDWSVCGLAVVRWALARRPDVTIFDFLHAAAFLPDWCPIPSILFTHNVETEIAQRCQLHATDEQTREYWRVEAGKMARYEQEALGRFDAILTVSTRDREHFHRLGVDRVFDIRNGIDLDWYEYSLPAKGGSIVFVGSMDWIANQDAMEHWFERIWPALKREKPQARLQIVGRNPSPALLSLTEGMTDVEVTGSVPDVRPYLRRSAVSILPFRIGGGTRMKAYESMAAGVPVVSTSIGIEGLPVTPGRHYLLADDPERFAQCVARLLGEPMLGDSLSRTARAHVEAEGSYLSSAADVARICRWAIGHARGPARQV